MPDSSRSSADDRSRWIALYVLCTGMLVAILDGTIVNVALPTIQDDLGFTQSNLAWVVNAYLIAFGGLLLLAGRLGDLISRRLVFMAGLGVFTAASFLCGRAESQGVVIGFVAAGGASLALGGGVLADAINRHWIFYPSPARGDEDVPVAEPAVSKAA